jgi:hypothetical protein
VSEIKVGDLVVVVRWPHEHANNVGTIWTVQGFSPQSHCQDCGKTWIWKKWRTVFKQPCAVLDAKQNFGLPLSWLRRIDPLAELNETEHKEETPA